MPRTRWWKMFLTALMVGALVLPFGCRKEAAPSDDRLDEPESPETEPAEAVFPESDDTLKPTLWDESKTDLDAYLETEPNPVVPGDSDAF